MKNLASALVAVFIGLLTWIMPAGPAAAAGYSALYVFGDSLSDTGNDLILTSNLLINPPIPPSASPHRTYFDGRFSNGPIAAEYLLQRLAGSNAELTPSLAVQRIERGRSLSFAYGGSGSGGMVMTAGSFPAPGAISQVEQFALLLDGRRADPNALYLVWSGANDYLQFKVTDPQIVVGNLVTAIRNLHALGARNFLVPNLPDMSTSPIVIMQGLTLRVALLNIRHNLALARALNALAGELRSAKVMLFDTYGTMLRLVLTGAFLPSLPGAELLAPGTGAADCLFADPRTCPDVPLERPLPRILYWDVLHPTTYTHQLIGNAMYQRVR